MYSYKLEGFDHDWNDIGTSNKAVFTSFLQAITN
ncbi:MAG: hypothetical protein IPF52_03100 [Saprospiraceae bacterium]|nr:hypothetical protein [Saprospiraceae bacterium]